MGKTLKILSVLALGVAVLGTVIYLNFYKPKEPPATTTVIKNPSQETSVQTNQDSQTSGKEAVERVRQLPEVKNYLTKVPNAHVEVSSFDEESGTYLVQVFEVKDGHTATFGWWEVEKISGKIKKSI